jgi:Flp pilus assembly protein CpaB
VAVQVVNLLVTPEQVEQLSLASHQTTIHLVLRNPLDRDVTKTPGADLAQLFGGGPCKPTEAPVPRARSRPHPPRPVVAEVAFLRAPIGSSAAQGRTWYDSLQLKVTKR